MASRLKTRLSAGAALVTGLGMVGIAAAVPAQAATELVYTCGTAIGAKDLTVTMDTDAPETVAPGETASVTAITGHVTIPSDLANAMAGFLEWDYVEGTTPDVASNVLDADGNTIHTVTTTLTTPKPHIFSEDGWVQDSGDTPELPLNGTGGDFTVDPSASGAYTIEAPETFTSTFTGTKRDDSDGGSQDVPCTYKSGDKTIDTITVEEPTEVSDWFTEPAKLPITEDGKSFTVKGEATQDGVLNVVLLDGDKKVLKTTPWNVTEGINTENFLFVEGTDYVRLISEDCVDADGNDGKVAGGCNVEYDAPWVNPDSEDAGEDNGEDADEDAGQDNGEDAGAEKPEIPGVVQTDGFARTAAPEADNTAGFALGGLLLAGAGAGVVLVAHRRQAQH